MRAVVQRVHRASVTVAGTVTGAIGRGLLVYLGVGTGDAEAAGDYTADKIAGLRVFPDDAGRMALDVTSVPNGGILVIPQFTLYGDLRGGRRPAFTAAMEPVRAEALYQHVVGRLSVRGIVVQTGVFRTHMDVESVNDGPVTLLIDSSRLF